MSIIATPPQDRRAIRTFVTKFDPPTIQRGDRARDARAAGRSSSSTTACSRSTRWSGSSASWCPRSTIGVAHGQMGEGQLEKVMAGLRGQEVPGAAVHHASSRAASTSRRANTMIVNRADTFGLAQLYQLRGRVGRSKERAYAYLLVPARRAVTRDAQRRLEVLQAFTELGAGFSIASRTTWRSAARATCSGDDAVGDHRGDRLRPVHAAAGGGGGGDARRAAAGGDRAGGHAAACRR